MDLSCELRKPNQYLFVVVKRDSARDPPSTDLMAYGVLALTKIDSTARISKVCTDPAFRRRGAGRLLVRSMLAALGHKDAQVAVPAAVACVPVENSSYNCGITELPPSQYIQLQRGGSSLMEISSIQLHVDKARDEAIRLYTRCGFHVKAEIASYYAEGRDALLMAIHFSQQDTAAA
ncbi:hypothetical protein GQ54DRAFT_295089 [Martensiomyces pterosporus]|nr:hypothetical protein GQ54DRAFT_295089 [Martensiomyces pterosporus]